MPTSFLNLDARIATLDLAELGKKLKHKKLPDPVEARPFTRPGRPAARIVLPWSYDLDYGWTPERERLEPRPPLDLPPYYCERFTFRTAGLARSERTAILIDLRSFPRRAKVFLRLPAGILRPGKLDALRQGVSHAPDGVWATVPETPEGYNLLFGEQETASVSADHVIVELAPHRRVVLDQLRLGAQPVEILIRYAVDRSLVRPKSMYVMHFAQLIDGFLVGEFEHVFQAYHPYDIPIVGDWRSMIAYRRSSHEVSTIPPLALAFFDTWEHAAALGFDPAPRSYAKHFRPEHLSAGLRERILAFVNDPETRAETLRRKVADNPQVSAVGKPEPSAKRKLGITRPTATRIIGARDTLPEKRFTQLEQIDAIPGVGPDTLSDLITSFLLVRTDTDRWYPDRKVLDVLNG